MTAPDHFPTPATRYPSALLRRREEVARQGTFRERVHYDLVDRPHHACGLLTAAEIAAFTGVGEIVAVEFGVAEGAGLLNLAEVAAAVTEETGVAIRTVGFDTGGGLPAPVDHRDHPEIWGEGDFAMADPDALRRRLPPGVDLVLGPVATTLPPFLSSLDAPVGFVSLDLDYYSSTRDALAVFAAGAAVLLPTVIAYFDDVAGSPRRIGSLFRTSAAGQLLAIDEFNAAHADRRIDPLRVLRHRRPMDREPWLDKVYGVHVLDHPVRGTDGDRAPLSMAEHGRDRHFDWPV